MDADTPEPSIRVVQNWHEEFRAVSRTKSPETN